MYLNIDFTFPIVTVLFAICKSCRIKFFTRSNEYIFYISYLCLFCYNVSNVLVSVYNFPTNSNSCDRNTILFINNVESSSCFGSRYENCCSSSSSSSSEVWQLWVHHAEICIGKNGDRFQQSMLFVTCTFSNKALVTILCFCLHFVAEL